MRDVILDVETTGLDPLLDRIIEVGCVELQDKIATGRTFTRLINPECRVSPDAEKIHGHGDADLIFEPTFAEVAYDLRAFLGDSQIIAHNASFDIGFLNAEFGRIGVDPIPPARTVDTLAQARQKYPGQSCTLDALCDRIGVSRAGRVKHGALLDAGLLAEVYLELLGRRQIALSLFDTVAKIETTAPDYSGRAPRMPHITAQETALHAQFIDRLQSPPGHLDVVSAARYKAARPMWLRLSKLN